MLFSLTTAFSQQTYPKIVTFSGILHPIVTISDDLPSYNFKNYYQVGLPTGINFWKSKSFGFSLQFIPVIRSENGTSKMSNFVFQPGALFALGKGYTFTSRLGFETSGRYGFTPIFSKVVKKDKDCSYYISTPMPVRFGNDKSATFTPSFEFGILF